MGSDARPTGHLYAFERDGGAIRWKLPFPRGVSVDLLRYGPTILAASMAGDVLAVEVETGEVAWWAEPDPEASAGDLSVDPALDAGRYYVPWRSGHLEAYDASNGERLWRRDLPATPNSSVVAVEGALVLGTIDGRLLRIDPASGETTAELALGSVVYGELVPTTDCLLALVAPEAGVDAPGHAVVCVEKDLGGVAWRHRSEATELGTFEPWVSGDEVVVGVEGRLLALALEDGELRWTYPVRGLPRGLGASDSTLFVGTLGGNLLALPLVAAEPAPAR